MKRLEIGAWSPFGRPMYNVFVEVDEKKLADSGVIQDAAARLDLRTVLNRTGVSIVLEEVKDK